MHKTFKIFFIFSLVFLLRFQSSIAQEKYTISGYVKDASNGEALIGARVFIKEIAQGTAANQYGFYSLTIDKGNYNLTFSFLSFKDTVIPIILDKNIRLNINLLPAAIEGKEFVVSDKRSDENVHGTQMGTTTLSIDKIKTLPAFMGEVDIIKTIQLLPGVQSAGEGNSGFYVRGGGPDENLILLDGANVYNASHLFGFFSIFNSDAINSVELIKGGMPAQYGGRLASVLDITMKEGNNQDYHVEGGIGLISSRFTAQGPIKKNKSSFIVSGRRTYIDVLMQPFISSSSAFKGSGYYFYDLNVKLNYEFSDRDKLYVSGYFGRDVFTYKNSETDFSVSVPWGNTTLTTRWNHLFNDKLFMNTSLIYTDYQFESSFTANQFVFNLFSGIKDVNAKWDLNYYPTIRHNIKFGADYTFHIFSPSSVTGQAGSVSFNTDQIKHLYANEAAVYVSDDFDLTDKIKLNGGLRYSAFQQVGPFYRYGHDQYGRITDSTYYAPSKQVCFYQGIEPRFSIRYSLDLHSSLKAAFTINNQYMHLASLSTVTLPTDVWVPSSSVIKPEIGTQYALGYFRNFKKDMYETSVEVYYKQMKNMIDYVAGSTYQDSYMDNFDKSFTLGKGWSYGVELFIKKSLGKFTGWIGYTLSYSFRNFPANNDSMTFPAKYDRRHDLSVVANYVLNEHWTMSSQFVYATGNAMTVTVGRYFVEGRLVPQYGTENGYRLDPYHRLDLSVTYIRKKHVKYQSSWTFSVYNAYDRHNPYFIYPAQTGSIDYGNLRLTEKQVSLFPILPSVTWNFKF